MNYPTDTHSQALALSGGAAWLLQPRLAMFTACTTCSKIKDRGVGLGDITVAKVNIYTATWWRHLVKKAMHNPIVLMAQPSATTGSVNLSHYSLLCTGFYSVT